MLRKLAVAFVAASIFAAPVLAQGTAATQPKADTPAAVAPTPKIVPAKPDLASAKVKPGKPLVRHVAHKHRKHVRRAHVKHRKHVKIVKARHDAHVTLAKVKHLKPVKHIAHAKAKYGAKHSAKHTVKPVRHLTRKSTTYAHSSSPAAHKSVN